MKTVKKTKLTLNKTMIANLDTTQMKDAKGKGPFTPDTDISFETCEIFCSAADLCSIINCTFRCSEAMCF